MVRTALVLLALTALSAPASAEPPAWFQERLRTPPAPPPPLCELPKLLPTVEVNAVGLRAASRPTPVQIDPKGAETRQADLSVTVTEAPVLLVLSAHDPVVWNIRLHPKATLAGVLATGHRPQAVAGVPEGVPVIINTDARRDCGWEPVTALQAGPGVARLQDLVKSMTERELSTFQAAEGEPEIVIGPLERLAELPPDDGMPALPPGLDEAALIPPGADGLARLVHDGFLKPAKSEDIQAWLDGANDRYGKWLKAPLTADLIAAKGPVYRVVKAPPAFPAGLSGKQAATFLVDAKLPYPLGPAGQSRFFLMEDFSCRLGDGGQPCPP